MDPDQTAPLGTVCLYAKIGLKSLQKYSADDINRRHLQMQMRHFQTASESLTCLRVNIHSKAETESTVNSM